MSLSHVIASGYISYWHYFFTDWWTYVGIVLTIGLFWLANTVFYDDFWGPNLFTCFLGVVSIGSIFGIAAYNQSCAQGEWQTNIAYPYISSLPTQHRDVVYLKVQDTSETTGGGGLFTFYVSSHDITHVLVLYKDNGTVQKLDVTAKLAMELSSGELPYITYQQLPQDLGNNVNAGMYNIVIHLPKNYKFDTIK
jgi:hypothetical protein